MAQEALGIARGGSGSGRKNANRGRVANPTASTPATFGDNLNWGGGSENGPSDPQPDENVCTFMGPSTTYLSGKGRSWPDDSIYLVKAALDAMRKHGYRCHLPLDDLEEDEDDVEEENDAEEAKDGARDNPRRSKEIAYLEEHHYEDLMVLGKKSDEVMFVITNSCGWLRICCNCKEAEEFVEEHLANSDHYLLSKVSHDEVSSTVGLPQDISITRRTGSERSSDSGASSSSIGTLFELKKGSKVIAKALCSYSNGEMDNSGPTIELFEVAKEWRNHGYGKLLLHQGLSSYFEDTFSNIVDAGENVKYNVCYCTNRHACEWFLRQGFQDWDGMGEELGRYL